MVRKILKREWWQEEMSLRYNKPEHFTRCHWQKAERVLPLWIVYRNCTAVYFILSFLYTIVPIGREIPEENHEKYLIFLTHWTYILEVFYFCLAFVIAVERATKENRSLPPGPMSKMPWHYQMCWVIFTAALPSSFVVTTIFWTGVYDPEKFPADLDSIIEHVFNSVFLLVDLFLVGFPVKFLHFYCPFLYGFIYMGFALTYQLSGGKGVKGMIPIYKILDWRDPGSALLTCCFCFLLLMFFFCLFCGISSFKFWIRKEKPRPGSIKSNSN